MPRRRRKRTRTRAGAFAGVTKQDFEAVARIFCKHSVPESATRDLASYFASQNPKFQTERFVAATRKC